MNQHAADKDAAAAAEDRLTNELLQQAFKANSDYMLADLNDYPGFMPAMMGNNRTTGESNVSMVAFTQDGQMLAAQPTPSASLTASPFQSNTAASNSPFLLPATTTIAAPHPHLENLRHGQMIERPRSAPMPDLRSRATSAASSTVGSPMLGASSIGSMSPHSPMPLTSAQLSALEDVERAQMAEANQQLMAQGIDTTGLSVRDLRNLANQLQSVNATTAAELRRHMHIQCEQKRRAQIKGGFEELKMLLPGTMHKKVSKAVILSRAIDHVQQLHSEREMMLAEIEHLRQENMNYKALWQDQRP